MKKCLVLLAFLPALTYSQCPEWIGKPYKNTKAFLGLIQQRLSFEFTDSMVLPDRSKMVFNDSSGLYICKITASNDSVLSIYLEAPNESMNQFTSWFKKEYLKCATSNESESIQFADCIVELRPVNQNKRLFFIAGK